MQYTEEEKKAIEYLKEIKNNCEKAINKEYEKNDEKAKEKADSIEIVFNLLEKQQKEIDSLEIKLDDKETELQILKDDIEADEIMYKSELEESYISKEEIRNKIEELQEELKSYEEMNMGLLRHDLIFATKERIRVLKELLGDEK